LAQGTGSFGRVTEDDVKLAAGIAPPAPAPAPAAAAASGGAPWPTGMTPMTSMQKAIAKNMEATLAVPVFRVTKQIVTDDFDLLYAKLRPEGVTVSALLAKARRSSIRCVTVSRFRRGRVRSVSRLATRRETDTDCGAGSLPRAMATRTERVCEAPTPSCFSRGAEARTQSVALPTREA